MDLLKKVKTNIDQNFSFTDGAKLLLATSGGIDSMVLASIFNQLNLDFVLAHCNFNLRGRESDLDEEFVKRWAGNNNRICFNTSFNTKKEAESQKISIEMAARNLRYQWFKNLLKTYNLQYIVTAHHADDNLETTLLNLTRGTGFKGLLGMPKKNEEIIRPLLPFSRAEIVGYAKKNNIAWREDQSNTNVIYTRNKIRHQVVPILKDINPNLISTYNKSLSHLEELESIINDRLAEVKKDLLSKDADEIYHVDLEKLLKLSNPKAYLFELLRDFNFTAWNDLENLLTAQSGKQMVSASHILIKDRHEFLIKVLNKTAETSFKINSLNTAFTSPQINLNFEKVLKADFNNKNRKQIYVDAKKITLPLIVRKWQNGDYFYPLGMSGKKKVSDFFTDLKLSLFEKENCWLLCQNSQIIWIIGYRLANPFKVTNQTKNILKITSR